MIERFFIHRVTVIAPTEGAEDVYGNPTEGESQGTVYGARVSPLGSEELLRYSDGTVTRKRLRLPPTASVESDSIVLWDGKTWQVEGEPEPMDKPRGGTSHIRAVIKRPEGA